jgi:hypothetical protein
VACSRVNFTFTNAAIRSSKMCKAKTAKQHLHTFILNAVCWIKYCKINLLDGIWITLKVIFIFPNWDTPLACTRDTPEESSMSTRALWIRQRGPEHKAYMLWTYKLTTVHNSITSQRHWATDLETELLL